MAECGRLGVPDPPEAGWTSPVPPGRIRWRAGELLSAIADGSISVTVSERYPLAGAACAHIDLQGRKTVGSIVLVP